MGSKKKKKTIVIKKKEKKNLKQQKPQHLTKSIKSVYFSKLLCGTKSQRWVCKTTSVRACVFFFGHLT